MRHIATQTVFQTPAYSCIPVDGVTLVIVSIYLARDNHIIIVLSTPMAMFIDRHINESAHSRKRVSTGIRATRRGMGYRVLSTRHQVQYVQASPSSFRA